MLSIFSLEEFVYRIVVFFFQAEDGIRDVAVTGVQTCALPISEEGHVRRRLNLVAELLIGLATHAGWSLRQRVEEVAVVSQARSQSVGSESGPAFRVLALALVDQAAAVPTQKVGAGRVQDPNTPSAGSDDSRAAKPWAPPTVIAGRPDQRDCFR